MSLPPSRSLSALPTALALLPHRHRSYRAVPRSPCLRRGQQPPGAQLPCGTEPGRGQGAVPMGRQCPFVLSGRERLAGLVLP